MFLNYEYYRHNILYDVKLYHKYIVFFIDVYIGIC